MVWVAKTRPPPGLSRMSAAIVSWPRAQGSVRSAHSRPGPLGPRTSTPKSYLLTGPGLALLGLRTAAGRFRLLGLRRPHGGSRWSFDNSGQSRRRDRQRQVVHQPPGIQFTRGREDRGTKLGADVGSVADAGLDGGTGAGFLVEAQPKPEAGGCCERQEIYTPGKAEDERRPQPAGRGQPTDLKSTGDVRSSARIIARKRRADCVNALTTAGSNCVEAAPRIACCACWNVKARR